MNVERRAAGHYRFNCGIMSQTALKRPLFPPGAPICRSMPPRSRFVTEPTNIPVTYTQNKSRAHTDRDARTPQRKREFGGKKLISFFKMLLHGFSVDMYQ